MGEETMRNEMIAAVVRRAIEHPEFRQRLIDNPQEALAAHGVARESVDRAEIDKIRARMHDSGDDEQQLVSIAENYGLKL